MKKNKGFSLVELIIVIAIMAILVGIMVPVMLHFIEKSNVSSDYQLADTIRSAVAYSIVDARVKDDPDSQPYLDAMENPTASYVEINGKKMISISSITGPCVLKESLEEYTGYPLGSLKSQIRSEHEADTEIYVCTTNGVVTVALYHTDSTGRKKPTTNLDIIISQ
ncbi:prepilin-type N-terminal cleavage/methylation domain-containing protein [Lachnospiraceae bacterium G41]|nr:prepilin-type N-terminal cleavage/methylation domain-containing protein [Lachnospiraceae bacterium G41]